MPKKRFNEKTCPIQKTRVPNALTQKMMESLRAARDADPHWEKAIEQYAAAEAALNPKDDPAEGTVVITKIIPPKRNP